MTRKRIIALVLLTAATVCVVAVVWHYVFPPLPFTGPYRGHVVDAETGQPLAGATVLAAWTCHDNPLPDGSGHHPVSASVTTDAAGAFTLRPPSRRGGWFGTDSVVRVSAVGYIEAVFIVDPNNVPLPPSTIAWPFADTTVHTSLPETMTIRLRPALPVLRQAVQSADPLIRDKAQGMLHDLQAGSL